MKIRMTFDIPKDANKWLAYHLGKPTVTREDFETMLNAQVTAWLDDLSSDYENKDNS